MIYVAGAFGRTACPYTTRSLLLYVSFTCARKPNTHSRDIPAKKSEQFNSIMYRYVDTLLLFDSRRVYIHSMLQADHDESCISCRDSAREMIQKEKRKGEENNTGLQAN